MPYCYFAYYVGFGGIINLFRYMTIVLLDCPVILPFLFSILPYVMS